MGIIYKARHVVMDKLVAVKMMHPHMVSATAFQRFQMEGRAGGMLTHPFIVAVRDLGTTQAGYPYMVMDYVEGETLADVIKKQVYLPEERFVRIFNQVCEALGQAHMKGVLHRDIKPSNIMLVKNAAGNEEIRIMDFGIAKLLSDTEHGAGLTRTGETLGSPMYMSPEQARGLKVDKRTDLYSLGCVMYETLSGSPPFIGGSALDTMMMHMNEPPLPLREASLGNEVDRRIEAIVMKLLEKDPSNRYQTMDDLKHDLSNFRSLQMATVDSNASNGRGTAGVRAARTTSESTRKSTRKNTAESVSAEHSDSRSRNTQPFSPVILLAFVLFIVGIAGGAAFFLLRSDSKQPDSAGADRSQQNAAPGSTATSGSATNPGNGASTNSSNTSQAGPDSNTTAAGSYSSGNNSSNGAESTAHGADGTNGETSTSSTAASSSTASPTTASPSGEGATGEEPAGSGWQHPVDKDLKGQAIVTYYLNVKKQTLELANLKYHNRKWSKLDFEPLLTHPNRKFVRLMDVTSLGWDDTILETTVNLRLAELTLDDNRCRDLHALKNQKNLTRLTVVNNPINHDGIRTISNLSNLTSLSLNRTPIRSDDLAELAKLKNLQVLNLQNCPNLSNVAIAKLQSEMPWCRISW